MATAATWSGATHRTTTHHHHHHQHRNPIFSGWWPEPESGDWPRLSLKSASVTTGTGTSQVCHVLVKIANIIIIDMHIIKYTQALFIRQWVFLMILDIIVLIDDNNVCPARSLLPCHYKALCIWQIMFNSKPFISYLDEFLLSSNFEGPKSKRQRLPTYIQSTDGFGYNLSAI